VQASGKIIEAHRHVDMIRAERTLPDFQRAPQKRFSLTVVPEVEVIHCEGVQGCGRFRILRTGR